MPSTPIRHAALAFRGKPPAELPHGLLTPPDEVRRAIEEERPNHPAEAFARKSPPSKPGCRSRSAANSRPTSKIDRMSRLVIPVSDQKFWARGGDHEQDLAWQINGKTIELDEDPGLPQGQAVEVQMKPLLVPGPGGEGLRRSAVALADDLYWDTIMAEIYQARKRDTRREVLE